MPLETLDDVNAILGQCCCEMPECPLPTREREKKYADHAVCGWSYQLTQDNNGLIDSDTGLAWDYSSASCQDRRVQYMNARYYRPPADEESSALEANLSSPVDAECDAFGNPQPYVAEGDYISPLYTSEVTFSNPITTDMLAEVVKNKLASATFVSSVENPVSSLFLFTIPCEAVPSGIPSWGGATMFRFKWVIPDTWTGSHFKITWDIATYPTDPDAEISYIQDLTWEWTGPGDPEDEDSWKSGWYEIDPPGEPGERKIVNVRYSCYRSPKFGNKPQITGDAEDITDDVPLQRRFTSDRHSINLLLT
jgi:hypothetical protein